eukprot:6047578-Prymnesium_polylepis.1
MESREEAEGSQPAADLPQKRHLHEGLETKVCTCRACVSPACSRPCCVAVHRTNSSRPSSTTISLFHRTRLI